MKFRVVEFKHANPTTGTRFFIEIGEPFKVKLWWFFYRTKIGWKPMIKDDQEQHEGFKDMDQALYMVNQLKEQLPIYHEIK